MKQVCAYGDHFVVALAIGAHHTGLEHSGSVEEIFDTAVATDSYDHGFELAWLGGLQAQTRFVY